MPPRAPVMDPATALLKCGLSTAASRPSFTCTHQQLAQPPSPYASVTGEGVVLTPHLGPLLSHGCGHGRACCGRGQRTHGRDAGQQEAQQLVRQRAATPTHQQPDRQQAAHEGGSRCQSDRSAIWGNG